MGVLNVTPDSFSDGGRFVELDAAVAHGLELFAAGADVVDVGGESTRPGAEPVAEDEERRRVVPVIEALAQAGAGRISIDTRKAGVAEAAVAAGATLVNDISASLAPTVARMGRPDVGWVAMHMQGEPTTMQQAPHYGDVVAEVVRTLGRAAEIATEAGIEEVWLDPGIGFGKSPDHNLTLLRHLDRIVALGHPVLVGTSRKRTLGVLMARSDGVEDPDADPVPVDDRAAGTISTEVWAFAAGARMVRSHDVRAAVQAARIAWAG